MQVNTSSGELSQVINQQQVSELPSLTRNPYDFVQLSGNVSSGDTTASGGSENTTLRGVGANLNGQRSTGTEILLDGVENVQIFSASVGIKVPLDAVQEFSVITSNYEPQYGRASGGVVNVATVAGTNKFHGSLWEFNRLAAYTANTVTNAQSGISKGGYTRNQFGFAVGGPIRSNKLFFFGSTEWIRVRSAAKISASVPTPQFLALSAPNVQAYFKQYGANQNFVFSNTTSAADLGITGIPGTTPVFGRVNFTVPSDAGGGLPQNTYNIVGRLDYNYSDKTQGFFRYVDYSEVDSAGATSYSPYSQYDVGQSTKSQAYLASVTHAFSQSLSTITKLSFSRYNLQSSYNTALQNTPTLVVAPSTVNPVDGTFIQLPGFNDTSVGIGGLPFGGPQNALQYNQDAVYVKGKHNLQFGAQIYYIQENISEGDSAQAVEQMGTSLPSGLQAFLSGNAALYYAAVNPGGALPCAMNPYTRGLTQTAACNIHLPAAVPSFGRSDRFHDWAAYFQDVFKVTPKLSIDYGVRYEYYGVQHNNNRTLDSNFFYGPGSSLPAQIRSGSVLTSPNSPVGGLYKPQYGTVAPRVSFAYDIFGNGKTSFRSGYGISYERNFGQVNYLDKDNPPAYAIVNLSNVPITNSNSPIPAGSGNSYPLPPTDLRATEPNIRTAQTHFWDAAIEQRLANSTVLGVQYTGSRGIHLYDVKNTNGLGSGNVLLGDPVTDPGGSGNQALPRLNPQYKNISSRGSGGDSYYEALNVQFQSTNLHKSGLSLVVNYTYSHEIDDLSTTSSESNNVFVLGYTNSFRPGLDRGPGDLDVRHRIVVAPIYKTHYDSQNRILSGLLGGWGISGIYTARTGVPFTYFDSTNYGGSLMDFVRYTPAGGVVPQRTFKSIPSSGAQIGPNLYQLGNLPAANSFENPALLGASDWGPYPATMTARNTFRGPGAWNVNAAVSKNFSIRNGVSVELRAEGFNLFNHHNLYIVGGLNDVAISPSGSNRLPITAQKGGLGGPGDERRFGQFAAKINF